MANDQCFFCSSNGGELIRQTTLYRIILVANADYPGYIQVVAQQHLKELSDLSDADNLAIYQEVIKVEKVLRQHLNPDKINIASFANMVPHVHWHIIPRFYHDKHFPNPLWGAITNPHYQAAIDPAKISAVCLSLSKDY